MARFDAADRRRLPERHVAEPADNAVHGVLEEGVAGRGHQGPRAELQVQFPINPPPAVAFVVLDTNNDVGVTFVGVRHPILDRL